MNIEDQVREALQELAAEAPIRGPRAAAAPATRPRSAVRRPVVLVAGLLVAVGAVAVATSALDDEPPPLVHTTEPPQVLVHRDWDAEQYNHAFEATRTAPSARLDLDDIAEGVTQTEVEGVVVFTVRRSDEVRVLLAQSPYDGLRVPYCQTSGWFESPAHGDMYDQTGAPANELAPRAMAEIPVVIDGDEVVIDLAGLTPGAPAEEPRSPQPPDGPHCLGPASTEPP